MLLLKCRLSKQHSYMIQFVRICFRNVMRCHCVFGGLELGIARWYFGDCCFRDIVMKAGASSHHRHKLNQACAAHRRGQASTIIDFT